MTTGISGLVNTCVMVGAAHLRTPDPEGGKLKGAKSPEYQCGNHRHTSQGAEGATAPGSGVRCELPQWVRTEPFGFQGPLRAIAGRGKEH